MRVLRLAGAAVVIAGCGGGGDGGGGPGPNPTVASVAVTPTSAQATSVCGEVSFSAQPRDAQGNNLSRNVSWTSSNAAAVVMSSNAGPASAAIGIGAGSSDITASADGVTSNPAVRVTVAAAGAAPASEQVSATANNLYSPRCVRIAAGGSVTWSFAIPHDVDFDGTTQPTGGNIPQTNSGTQSRTFPTAGQYPYHCNLHPGMNGRVIVQ